MQMDANKFTQKSIEAIKDMQTVASEHGNQQLEQVHLLYALASKDDGLIPSLVKQMGIDDHALVAESQRAIEGLTKVTGVSSERLYLSRDLEAVFNCAEAEAKKMHDEYISVATSSCVHRHR